MDYFLSMVVAPIYNVIKNNNDVAQKSGKEPGFEQKILLVV